LHNWIVGDGGSTLTTFDEGLSVRQEAGVKQADWVAALTFVVMGSACGPPGTHISGPSESKEGIKVELLNVECERISDEGDMFHEIKLAMDLAIRNDSDQAVQFRPDRMRIVGSGGAEAAWAASRVPIPKGARRVTQVRFFASSGVTCRDRMKLDFADSLTFAEVIREAPIEFIPEQ
jgi:hypothetical protein